MLVRDPQADSSKVMVKRKIIIVTGFPIDHSGTKAMAKKLDNVAGRSDAFFMEDTDPKHHKSIGIRARERLK